MIRDILSNIMFCIESESALGKSMKSSKNVYLLHFLFIFNLFPATSVAPHTQTNYCGKIRTQTSSLNSNTSKSSLLGNITICRSQKLYFRTSIGLFQVSSIDYGGRLLTISHSSCSSSLQYVSPLAVTAGFPSTPEPNSLLLFNCSSRRDNISPFVRNCRGLNKCGETASMSSLIQEDEIKPYPCLIIDDLQKVDKGFHPKDLNCSHYSWVYKNSSEIGDYEGYKLGTRMSFDIPGHVPDLCKECEKPNGNCGVGLKCICHARECKDKIISKGRSINSIGTFLFALLSITVVIAIFIDV
ncbi:hypothetical protein L6164_018990 [Bauhinia variegata]|uniref:Uncharacterized protein n=1 Tax=Bauhinia variegata TaxID=167791 RepID=A0ACB9NHV5_BAUVA|nr:hypothetical protein L6164_018990 [Bauhinia variegata]